MKSYGLLTVVLLQTVLIIRAISTISISIKMNKKWRKKTKEIGIEKIVSQIDDNEKKFYQIT